MEREADGSEEYLRSSLVDDIALPTSFFLENKNAGGEGGI
jgi:hypothetical protein